MTKTGADTPMFRQYLELKAQNPDAFLFFRMGDFYELFFDDAREAAGILEITLTSRNRRDPDPVPMCGVPWRNADTYVKKLLDAGHKVAIADQVEDPRLAKGLVKRKVVRVVSPGVVMDPEGLVAREPNYLFGLLKGRGGRFGLAFLDASTGDLKVTELETTDAVQAELASLQPHEAVLPESFKKADWLLRSLPDCLINWRSASHFSQEAARRELHSVLGVSDFSGFGAQDADPALQAAGALLHYARDNAKSSLAHVKCVRRYHSGAHMVLDATTHRNLELERSMRGGGRKGTLTWLMDRSSTAMGGRLLREWLAFPLMDPAEIRKRQDYVEAFVEDSMGRKTLRTQLRKVADLERICSKVAQTTANARDLSALRASLRTLPSIASGLEGNATLKNLVPDDQCLDIMQEIDEWLVDDPPLSTTEGDLIRRSADPELDELITLARRGKGAIAEMEQRERASTGIANLKIRHHRSQGYYLEVTRANLHKVPEHYTRWQTLTNVERFYTPELKEFEERILGADVRRKRLEHEHFLSLRSHVESQIPRLQSLAAHLALLDVLSSFADLAVSNNYIRPVVDAGEAIELEEARHPVVENSPEAERFVPNDLRMDRQGRRFIVLTGPNMSGKSTIMRQVALIVLMAQTGSFVPARKARIGVCDRIFVRVGASDDIARGRSTFMVEMAETANILHHASRRSLVLLDEIGRGTSTYDGLAIAWSVAEALHDRLGCRTIFATHYHELAGFARRHSHTVNMKIAVSQMGEKIIFLRRLQNGTTSRSYGIQCARLAGMPDHVLGRAKKLLKELERRRPRNDRQLSLFDPTQPKDELADATASLPEAPSQQSTVLHDALRVMNPDEMTPREALDALYRLKKMC